MSVEIIGRACAAPGANSPEELFELMRARKCAISQIPYHRWDIARFWHPEMGVPGKYYTYAAGVLDDIQRFDPALFGISRREAIYMDPQQRILLELTWRALEDANIPATELQGQNVAVYVGASSIDNGNLSVEDPAAPGPHFMTGNTLSIVSNRISHVFGLNGPSLTVDTACSSSLVALDHAVRAINSGEVDTAIVGGINILVHPLPFVGFSQARMLSKDGLCRAYDNDGIGYVRAEGAGVLVLRESDRARELGDRSHATIIASGINAAGRTNGISLPSREAQAVLLESIYIKGGIDPEDIAFIEGHGTGTKVGDPAEVWSLGQVLGRRRSKPVPIGSVKTNIGHAEPASGLLGLMKAMLALENDYLPASLHFDTPNETIDFEGLNVSVASEAIALERGSRRRLAGVNSFGFGGANAHVVIADPDNGHARKPIFSRSNDPFFVVSAHTADSLKTLVASYRERLVHASGDIERDAVISAAGGNRTSLRHRFVVKGGRSDIMEALDAFLSSSKEGAGEVGEAISRDPKVALAFSGNGAQWAGMGVEALRANAMFRESYERIAALFSRHSDLDLVEALSDPELDGKLADTKLAQPLLFAVQAALADAMVSMGLKITATFGHSVGEVAAAYAAGALTLEDAVVVIAKRSLHQDVLAGEGTMAALKLGEQAARELIETLGLSDLQVAAVNASNSVTVSGSVADISLLREKARKRKIAVQPLDINYPFHHPLIDRARDAFMADMPAIRPQVSTAAFLSTVTGTALCGESLTPDYWWRNVRQPVKFLHAVEEALALGCNIFVEMSPRPILTGYINDVAQQHSAAVSVVSTLNKESGSIKGDPVTRAMARALANGCAVDTNKVFGDRNAFVSLPPLPFDRVDLPPEVTSDRVDIYGREQPGSYTLLGWRVDPNGATWKNHVDALLFPDLAEHVVDDRAILPGSGFIEIAVCAAREYFGTSEIEISNLEIVRPLELSESRISELSTVISPETGDLSIRSRERLSDDDWTVHVVARVRKITNAEGGSGAPRVDGKGKVVVDAGKAYETAKNFGLDYGPRLQLLERAVVHDDRLIEVDLKAAAAVGHPLLHYNLNPLSVDAVFHGLVALFDRFSGDKGGAPYIPVRFGKIRIEQLRVSIRRAVMEIERLSPSSIKASFHLFDEAGRRVAVFSDSRFRRTYLKQHKTLDALSFHYEAVPHLGTPSIGDYVASALKRSASFFAEVKEEGLDNATFLLQAAVLSAMHDIAGKLASDGGQVRRADLPKDRILRAFLWRCLDALVDAGFARHETDDWSLHPDFPLPAPAEILGDVYANCAERVVEAILINDVHREALARISSLSSLSATPEGERTDSFVSEATVAHQSVHSPLARARAGMLLEGLSACLGQNASAARPLRVLELGSLSVHVSQRLADVASSIAKASLIVCEPDSGARRSLEVHFENDTHVRVISPEQLEELGGADVVVSASGHFSSLLSLPSAGALLRAAYAFIGVFNSPSVFNDFVYGLNDDWFADDTEGPNPAGGLPDAAAWRTTFEDLGFASCEALLREMPGGGLISVEAFGRQPDVQLVAEGVSDASMARVGICLLLHDGSIAASDLQAVGEAAGSGHVLPLAVGADLEKDRKAIIDALHENCGSIRSIFYLSPEPAAAADGSLVLQKRVSGISAYAMALSECRDTVFVKRQNLRLVVVAPGGASVVGAGTTHRASPVNSGLWSFLRVVRNEFDFLDVRSIDPRVVDGLSSFLAWGSAVAELDGANCEWIVDGTTQQLNEVRAVPGAVRPSDRSTDAFAAAMIRQQVPSQVSSIRWESCELPQIGPDEVLVKVSATGLNFRDVMWAMGLLPEEALEDGFAGASIGMEFSGEVVATGDDVDDLMPGDAVMAIAAKAFSTHVAVKRAGLAKLPATIDLVAAASVPVVFLTAYYSIVELGRMRAGETILIHGAAGGVGLAALQVAKHIGATVIATAGTSEKRRFLEMLGADHVFDSRSLGFVQDVLDVTGGEGVDVVLNSLFGEAMELSLSLVKPFGRFLELGKRDYYADSKIGLRPFRRNISYFGIDADQLLVLHPELSRRMLSEIGALFEKRIFSPLPYRAFAYDEIGEAFRLMQNAGHIGKIVVLPPVPGRDHIAINSRRDVSVDPLGVHLVVGGIGGFGLAAANWLVEKGATHIALCSRRGQADDQTAAAIERWKKIGVTATLHACDVTDEQSVANMLTQLRKIAPLKSVVHAAMVLDDALIANLTAERNRPVIDVKAKGAANLDRLTRSDRLDQFIVFSSVTTLVGNPGQSNYVAANGFMEGLMRARRQAGLPGLAVGFGAIADAGYLARNRDVGQLLDRRLGKTALNAREALSCVEQYIALAPDTVDAAVVMISQFDWATAHNLPVVNESLFELVMRKASHNTSAAEGGSIDLVAMIQGKSAAEAQDALFKVIAGEIAAILRVSIESVTKDSVLKEIGLDSLMAVELGLNFEQSTGFDMPLSSLSDNATVGDVTKRLYEKVGARSNNSEASADTPGDAQIFDELSRRHTGSANQAAAG